MNFFILSAITALIKAETQDFSNLAGTPQNMICGMGLTPLKIQQAIQNYSAGKLQSYTNNSCAGMGEFCKCYNIPTSQVTVQQPTFKIVKQAPKIVQPKPVYFYYAQAQPVVKSVVPAETVREIVQQPVVQQPIIQQPLIQQPVRKVVQQAVPIPQYYFPEQQMRTIQPETVIKQYSGVVQEEPTVNQIIQEPILQQQPINNMFYQQESQQVFQQSTNPCEFQTEYTNSCCDQNVSSNQETCTQETNNMSTNNQMFTIITMENCRFCKMALELMNEKNLNVIKIDRLDTTARSYIETANSHRQRETYPMIFRGNEFIGGYDDLKRLYG